MGALAKFGPSLEKEDVSAELRFRQAQKLEAVGRLVSGVAHDFNNLLTGIVLCSDLLLAGLEKESRLHRYAQEIRTAGAQGASLIQQLMAVAAPHAPDLRCLSINQVIGEMSNFLKRLIGENIELTTDLADNLALVEMDAGQVQQIILNLVLNARDAMLDGGRITVRTRNGNENPAIAGHATGPQPTIELEIRDTGCGMDAATRARVFEPFFTTKKPGKGSGLGLSTLITIVQEQKGTVEIESARGQGTAVTVRLPGIAAELQETGKSDPASGFEHSEQPGGNSTL